MEADALNVERMGRGYAWLDTGTPDSLVDAASFVRTLEARQGVKICCPEEIAFDQGFIGAAELEALADRFGKSAYGQYLRSVLDERRDFEAALTWLGSVAPSSNPRQKSIGWLTKASSISRTGSFSGTWRAHKKSGPASGKWRREKEERFGPTA